MDVPTDSIKNMTSVVRNEVPSDSGVPNKAQPKGNQKEAELSQASTSAKGMENASLQHKRKAGSKKRNRRSNKKKRFKRKGSQGGVSNQPNLAKTSDVGAADTAALGSRKKAKNKKWFKRKAKKTQKPVTAEQPSGPQPERTISSVELLGNRILKQVVNMAKVMPAPTKVKTLNLKDMTFDDIVKTFREHKEVLDQVYEETKNKNSSDLEKYKGIWHGTIMALTSKDMQLQMMFYLVKHYQTKTADALRCPQVFANALMPEWHVRIFMKKYNFETREAAVKHMDDAFEYRSYEYDGRMTAFDVHQHLYGPNNAS